MALAIYHATLKTFSRSHGHSATAAAAYRAGRRLHDQRTGLTHDFRPRKGVASVMVLAPDDAPAWSTDLEALWNAAEASESRINARVARELEIALPAELDAGQRKALAEAVAQELVDRYGVAVTVAIHEPSETGDARNFHAHLLMTTRSLTPDGLGPKVRILDDQKTGPIEVTSLRERVADLTNDFLARAGLTERVDHRSLADQAEGAAARGNIESVRRLVREPQVHEGKSATAAKRRGGRSQRVDTNAALVEANQALFFDFVRSTDALPMTVRRRAVHPEPTHLPSATARVPVVRSQSSIQQRSAGASLISRQTSSRLIAVVLRIGHITVRACARTMRGAARAAVKKALDFLHTRRAERARRARRSSVPVELLSGYRHADPRSVPTLPWEPQKPRIDRKALRPEKIFSASEESISPSANSKGKEMLGGSSSKSTRRMRKNLSRMDDPIAETVEKTLNTSQQRDSASSQAHRSTRNERNARCGTVAQASTISPSDALRNARRSEPVSKADREPPPSISKRHRNRPA
jgi:hypothetical protein